MSTLIIPCAGRSSRFSTSKPKWMLTHPNGNLMLMESLFGITMHNISRIIITVVKDHIESSKINLSYVRDDIFEQTKIKPEFLILDEFTSSQSDTVYQTINKLELTGPIFIKDCDNYFNVNVEDENAVCISTLQSGINAVNKSYVSVDKFGHLSGIVEKQVIGDKFCVGGYSFKSATDFAKTFLELKSLKGINTEEIYISHIVQKMLLNHEVFEIHKVENYSDWGTIDDWKKYISEFKTIFVDMDGVLVENASEYFSPEWGNSNGLTDNIDLLNKMYDTGKVKIIITTSRKEHYKSHTLSQLKKCGIKYHSIIFDLPHARRFLINDYANSNPYPTAVAINLARNSNNLKDIL